MRDPYQTLGVDRNASEADIKKAYKKEALRWHPDKNPDNREEAQRRFADATGAYDILKDPASRQQYDMTGQVGGAAGPQGAPRGFHHHGNISQEDAERIFREAFGQQGLEGIFQQLFQQQQGGGGFGGFQPPRTLQVGMEVKIKPETNAIHAASRASGIDTENDARRSVCAGKSGEIIKVDPQDQSVKIRIQVQPGRADELWFGAGAVELPNQIPPHMRQQAPFSQFGRGMPGMGGGGCGGGGGPRPKPKPEGLQVDMEVQIRSNVETIHKASRASGISEDNDARRARCAGKEGTIIDTDPKDQSVKVRVQVLPGRADEVWFGAGAVEPLPEQHHASFDPSGSSFAGGARDPSERPSSAYY
jgi:hypothetical protein